MGTRVQCPVCGTTDFDVRDYESMMVLSAQLALFGLRCNSCGTLVSSVCVIPPSLHSDIEQVARRIGAGMGQETRSR